MTVSDSMIVKTKQGFMSVLSFDDDPFASNPSKIVIEGKEYEFHKAYDMKNTIGVDNIEVKAGDNVEFKL